MSTWNIFGLMSILMSPARIHIRDVQNGFFKFNSFFLEKPRIRFGFLCKSVVKYKKTCKLSFLYVHFAFWLTVF